MRIVIDTNIVVSAALSPYGNPRKIIKLIEDSEKFQMYCSLEIMTEYKEVLSRPHLRIASDVQNLIIKGIEDTQILIEPTVSTIPLPDETDRIFYDAAKAARATLITGNTKHFPAEPFIMTSAAFLDSLSSDN